MHSIPTVDPSPERAMEPRVRSGSEDLQKVVLFIFVLVVVGAFEGRPKVLIGQCRVSPCHPATDRKGSSSRGFMMSSRTTSQNARLLLVCSTLANLSKASSAQTPG